MQIHTHSEAGHEHRCEDRFLVVPHPGDSRAILCALADGQGGQFGGAEAAQAAVRTCISLASLAPPSELLSPHAWLPIVAAADEAVSDDPQAGYATLIAFCVLEGAICGASVGDSALLLRTADKDRLLTEEQRKNPPIGSGAAFPTAFSAQLRSPWTVLAVTDGVYRDLGWGEISRLVRRHSGQELPDALLQAQKNAHGGSLGDDFTTVLIEG